VASFRRGPNVSPLSVLILEIGSLLVAFAALSHHVTNILSPAAFTSAFNESIRGVLLRFILSPNVAPLSLGALKNTSPSLACVLSSNQTMWTLLPDVATGAFHGSGSGSTKNMLAVVVVTAKTL
jgi:hypothetical protein